MTHSGRTTRPDGHPERQSGSRQLRLRHTCPLCNSSVHRIPRRFSDRLLSLFMPVLRYGCGNALCEWEGTLRVHRNSTGQPTSRFVDGSRHFLLEASRMRPD